jgi:2-polyprenyl-3-methyl-5-hydroxy-6-metoxy-1,4-benzoquinol methylase
LAGAFFPEAKPSQITLDLICLEALAFREFEIERDKKTMDAPELTERFVTLASVENRAIVYYYRYKIVPIILKYIKRSDHLIDLGCGGGVLLSLLKTRGFDNLWGIDAAQVLLDRIPDKTIPTICDNYLNVKQHYNENQFDAAIVFNTLHHLDSKEELYQFFENLHYILKPGSIVMVKELHNGLFYKTYNAIIFSKIANKFLPSVFAQRNFVQTTENDMHSRFFRDFADCLDDIIETKGKFKIIKQYKPLTFERLIVAKVKK